MKTIAELTGVDPVNHILFRTTESESIGPAGNQILGIEIEVENLPRGHGHYSDLLHRAWQIKTDNSLRGASGEFITNPMKASELLPTLNSFYNKTGFTEANFTDRCSIHVHANVQDFTVDQLACLTLMYQTVEDIFFEFVGHYRDTNLYCIPWNQCRMSYKIIPRMFRSDGSFVESMRGWQKYTALNLLPILGQGTVEFRHMHGTADLTKIKTWILLISNLMYVAKSANFEDTLNTIKTLNTSSQYQGWFEKIVQGVLPYDDRYRPHLLQGIVNAKYSFLTLDPKKSGKSSSYEEFLVSDRTTIRNVEGLARVREAAQRLRIDTEAATQMWTANIPTRVEPQPQMQAVQWDEIFAEEVRRMRREETAPATPRAPVLRRR